MNPWPFVTAAYGVVICLTAALLLCTFASMRRAEAAADSLTSSWMNDAPPRLSAAEPPLP